MTPWFIRERLVTCDDVEGKEKKRDASDEVAPLKVERAYKDAWRIGHEHVSLLALIRSLKHLHY